ncbi:low molecular weight protein-tyrosine-phosphatase [Faecalispora anaeroviscerum]|uniref:low molecular weight protein-tyrosine-phosphatase n=1 Tax=Faecalispora anaeroviscerum TaxID=2991836 RepID=UPI0024B9F666|nr:low molecular weight protein-tyrosine-phosphatase [Faecalispora anaeroviscerum]
MVRVLFVCHGNICRSPMAEFLLKRLAAERGCEDELLIASAATSTEEIGNPVHRGTVTKLAEHGISCAGKHAVQLTRRDYPTYDYLLGMDRHNLQNMARILGTDDPQKIRRLLDFSAHPRDIADPWYTGNFDVTYEDILEGCNAFLDFLETSGLIHPKRNRNQ